jgi:hypothetical protein
MSVATTSWTDDFLLLKPWFDFATTTWFDALVNFDDDDFLLLKISVHYHMKQLARGRAK